MNTDITAMNSPKPFDDPLDRDAVSATSLVRVGGAYVNPDEVLLDLDQGRR